MKTLLLLLTLPYTFATILLTLPLAATASFLTSKFKDLAFHNSVRYVLLLILWPLLMIVYTITAFVCMPPLWAILAILVTIPAPAVAHDTYRAIRLMISDFKLLRCNSLLAKYDEIKNLFFK